MSFRAWQQIKIFRSKLQYLQNFYTIAMETALKTYHLKMKITKTLQQTFSSPQTWLCADEPMSASF